jgi:hypothetical protein
MTNHHNKFEVHRLKGSLVITRRPFGRRTDGPTSAKQYTPSSSKWGHNNKLKVFNDVRYLKEYLRTPNSFILKKKLLYEYEIIYFEIKL